MNLLQKSIPRVQLPIRRVQIALVKGLKKTLAMRFGDEGVIKFTKDFKVGFFGACVWSAISDFWLSGRKMTVSGPEDRRNF